MLIVWSRRYYTQPSLAELGALSSDALAAVYPFVIGHTDYGERCGWWRLLCITRVCVGFIRYQAPVDLRRVNLDDVVFFDECKQDTCC